LTVCTKLHCYGPISLPPFQTVLEAISYIKGNADWLAKIWIRNYIVSYEKNNRALTVERRLARKPYFWLSWHLAEDPKTRGYVYFKEIEFYETIHKKAIEIIKERKPNVAVGHSGN